MQVTCKDWKWTIETWRMTFPGGVRKQGAGGYSYPIAIEDFCFCSAFCLSVSRLCLNSWSKKHLLFCRFWFPKMFTTSVPPETKIFFNFPSLQLFMKNIKLKNKVFSLGKKNEWVFFNLSNIKQFFTSNSDNFKRKGCDSIIVLGKPFFFLVCSCVNNLKVSNFPTKFFFAYKHHHQLFLCEDAAPKSWS